MCQGCCKFDQVGFSGMKEWIECLVRREDVISQLQKKGFCCQKLPGNHFISKTLSQLIIRVINPHGQ